MKCPNCNKEMKEGRLYCEYCGRDIHIVPDFEPELEYSVVRMAEETESRESDTIEKTDGKTDVETGGAHRLLITGFVLLVLLIGMIGTGVFLYRDHSYDYQTKAAAKYLNQRSYEKAVRCYKRALELNPSDIEIRFSLAEAYLKSGNKLEYEYQLRGIINSTNSDGGQLERAYGKLIAIYKDRGEYDTINEILQSCPLEKIRNSYKGYIADPPEFNYESGYYTTAVPLKLTACATGRIYYTLDGSEPTEESSLYISPILLENGVQEVRAVFVNEYGVKSKVAARKYIMDVDLEREPYVSVLGGTYHVPMFIEAGAEEGFEQEGTLYYTTDGTVPNLHSYLYTDSIPMPLGKSYFRFAYIKEDGTCGKIAERRYELILDTSLTAKDAEDKVKEYLLEQGRILDEEGHFSAEYPARYLYQCQYAVNIESSGIFYVIAELYTNGGVEDKTGNYYAVKTDTAELFKLFILKNNNYTLVGIL